jgi:hypothetical protein
MKDEMPVEERAKEASSHRSAGVLDMGLPAKDISQDPAAGNPSFDDNTSRENAAKMDATPVSHNASFRAKRPSERNTIDIGLLACEYVGVTGARKQEV